MSLAVDNPILNNPFEEPREYWICEEGQPKRMSGKYQEAERRIEVIIAEVLEEGVEQSLFYLNDTMSTLAKKANIPAKKGWIKRQINY
ncbi:hypothetical protein [Candidatus Kuenenia sp.]|uniref:hypothetical protein n=1 Tax=Candidatus Kuenenia sp. TaxID=2499824 RepID=UPI0032200405